MTVRTSITSMGLLLVVLIAYWSTLACGLFPWDDQEYSLAASQLLEHPLDIATPVMGNFHPLTMASLAFDHWWSGGGPLGAHLTNILLHALNAILVFLLCRSLMRSDVNGLFVALLFAVHPMHVEGVAWISERKNVLYVLFFLAATWRYLHYLRHPSPWLFAQVLLLFVAALLSKAQAVTLPLVLFSIAIMEEGWSTWKRRSLQLLPFVVLSLLFSALAIVAQRDGGYLHWEREALTLDRLLIPPLVFMTTLRRILFPYDLSVIHPLPNQLQFLSVASSVLLLGVVYLFCRGVRKSERNVPAVIMIYVAAVLPILQIVPIGSVLTADRYGYLASIPVLALCVKSLSSLPLPRKVYGIILGMGCCALLTMTMIRATHWCSPIILFEEAVARYPESEIARMNLAGELISRGELSSANAQLEGVLKLDGNMVEVLIASGQMEIRDNKPNDALLKAERAIALAPEHRSIHLAYLVRAQAKKMMGRPEQALKDLLEAAQHNNQYAPLYLEQGICQAMVGEHRAALASYDKARKLGNKEPTLLLNIAISQGWVGDYSASISTVDELLAMDPQVAEAWFLKGIALGRLHLGGCKELAQAKALGHARAGDALDKLCP